FFFAWSGSLDFPAHLFLRERRSKVSHNLTTLARSRPKTTTAEALRLHMRSLRKFAQPSASIRFNRSFLLVTPMTWSRNWPFLKKSSAGIARMLYLDERLWLSSTFTLAIFTAPAFSRAISSSSGLIILHGPHHSAQKSTIIGLSSCVSSRSKFDS